MKYHRFTRFTPLDWKNIGVENFRFWHKLSFFSSLLYLSVNLFFLDLHCSDDPCTGWWGRIHPSLWYWSSREQFSMPGAGGEKKYRDCTPWTQPWYRPGSNCRYPGNIQFYLKEIKNTKNLSNTKFFISFNFLLKFHYFLMNKLLDCFLVYLVKQLMLLPQFLLSSSTLIKTSLKGFGEGLMILSENWILVPSDRLHKRDY